jgi:predicted RNase H-like nuclease (RuvC/YqgF family)
MNEWTFILAILSFLLLALFCAVASRCGEMGKEIKRLESQNADLRYSVKHLKAENQKLQNGVYVTPDTERITALKLSLHLKQEKIDALQAQVKKQRQLLNQKWEDAKK